MQDPSVILACLWGSCYGYLCGAGADLRAPDLEPFPKVKVQNTGPKAKYDVPLAGDVMLRIRTNQGCRKPLISEEQNRDGGPTCRWAL